METLALPPDILRVLLLEDSVFEARLIERVLASSRHVRFEVEHVATLAAALAALAARRFDVVLADLVLPDAEERQTMRALLGGGTDLPTVVLTRIDDEELGVQALKEGAQDYLVKDSGVRAILVRTLRHAVERHRLFEALREARAEAQYLATHDRLTHLPNRYLLHDRLDDAIAFAERHGQRLAVHFLDLDGFKQINDNQGHGAGDDALRWVAGQVVSCLRRSDTVARMGGDELVVLQRGLAGGEEAETLARRILEALDRTPAEPSWQGSLRASIGIALYPRDGATPDALLGAADAAMYLAKAEGGQRFCLAGERSRQLLPALHSVSRGA